MAVSPITIPLVEDGNVTGVIDIVANKAYRINGTKMKKHPFQTLLQVLWKNCALFSLRMSQRRPKN